MKPPSTQDIAHSERMQGISHPPGAGFRLVVLAPGATTEHRFILRPTIEFGVPLNPIGFHPGLTIFSLYPLSHL